MSFIKGRVAANFVKFGLVAFVGVFSVLANAQVVFNEDFGNSPGRVSSPYVPLAHPGSFPGYYSFLPTGFVNDGMYAITRPQNINASMTGFWPNLPNDHTFYLNGATDGALLALNAGSSLDPFYSRNFDIQPGASYRVSVWRYTINADINTRGPIAWSLRVQEVNSGSDLINSGLINNRAVGVWEESVYEFSVPTGCTPKPGGLQAKLTLRNESRVTMGNDIYIDDIVVSQIAYDPTLPSTCPQERSAVVADDDSTTTPINTPVTVGVKGNDSTTTGSLGNPTVVTPPPVGTATVNPDGTITYTPPANYTGEVRFKYNICNGATPQSCDVATVTVTIAPSPQAVPTLGLGALAMLSSIVAGVGLVRRRKTSTSDC